MIALLVSLGAAFAADPVLPADYCFLADDETPIPAAAAKIWGEVPGAPPGQRPVSYALDPSMPGPAQEAFRDAALQFSNQAGSALEGGVDIELVEVPWVASVMTPCLDWNMLTWADPAAPDDEKAEIAVFWFSPSQPPACPDVLGRELVQRWRRWLASSGDAFTPAVTDPTTVLTSFTERNGPNPSRQVCLANGRGAILFNADVPVWGFASDELPTYNTPTISFGQVALHELTHSVLFTRHVSEVDVNLGRFDPSLHELVLDSLDQDVSLLDANYPHGGDPGGSDDDAVPVAEGTLRVGPRVFSLLGKRYSKGDGVHNLLLYKWEERTQDEAAEIWTDSDSGDFSRWRISSNGDTIEFPSPRMPLAGYVSSEASATVSVEWFLSPPAGPCTEYTMTRPTNDKPRDRTLSAAQAALRPYAVPSWTEWIGRVQFELPSDRRYEIPSPKLFAACGVPEGTYRLCAQVSFADAGAPAESSADDNQVLSNRVYEVIGTVQSSLCP